MPRPSRYCPRAAAELLLRAPPATVAGWAFAPLIGMPCGRTGSSRSSSALATTLTRSCSTPRMTPRAPAATAAAATRGSSAPKSTSCACGARARTRRVKPTLSGRVTAVSARTTSAGLSASRIMASVSLTAVRTTPVMPSRAAVDATVWAASGVRTHTRTVRTVILLLSQRRSREGRSITRFRWKKRERSVRVAAAMGYGFDEDIDDACVSRGSPGYTRDRPESGPS